MNVEIRKDIFGYFDNPLFSDVPSHDPGLETICPLCADKLKRPVKTISLMRENDPKSYFYRTHKSCYENASEDEIMRVESSLIDNL